MWGTFKPLRYANRIINYMIKSRRLKIYIQLRNRGCFGYPRVTQKTGFLSKKHKCETKCNDTP